jgi:hypothetical protein
MRDKGEAPLLPVNPAPYLAEWLFDMGPTVAGAMGEAALGYQDMAAWQAINGVELMPWEASLLRRLSGEYAVMRDKAKEMACPAPYTGAAADDLTTRRDQVAQQVDALFGKLKRKEA